jgi:UDP-N-acetylglucosamine diphosphorylase/glucosamine-1-phosphate N-acetyltransferase
MKALVLTAGKGRRLRPITANRSKSMLMIAGHPVLEYIIESLKENGINDIIILVGHGREELINHFQMGEDYDVRTRYVIQHDQKGVEDAILTAKSELENENEFLLVNGDVLVEPDMVFRTLTSHETMGSEITMLVTLVANPDQFGTVKMGPNGEVERLVEKGGPDRYVSNYAVAGVSVFSSDILPLMEQYKTMEATFGKLIGDGRKIIATVWEKEWAEFTWPWDLLKANRIVMDQRIRGQGSFIADGAEIHPDVVIEGPVHIGEGTIIRPNTTIRGPVYIGKNVYIGNNSLVGDYASICQGVNLGYSVEIRNSMIFDRVNIGRLTFIADSIIGADTCIESGSQMWNWRPGNKPLFMRYAEKDVEIPFNKFGAIIGDGVVIGVNTSLFPTTRIGEYSTISAGCIIKEDIPPNSDVSVEQKLIIKSRKDSEN